MASTINASSSSGIIQTADTSAILQLQTAGTTAITVDTSTNVGIGTASPSTKLSVVHNQNGASQVSLLNNTGGASSQALFNANDGTNYGQFGMWGSGVSASGAQQPSNAFVYGSGGISYFTGGTHRWYYSTNTEAMRIDSSGNVGIGTSSPSAKLDVNGVICALGGNSPTGGFNLRNTSGTITPRMTNDGGDGTVIRAGASGGSVKFNNFTNTTEMAQIDSSGNLLVGTTSLTNAEKFSLAFAGSSQSGITLNDTSGTSCSLLLFRNNGTVCGSISKTTTLTAYNVSSDYRLKENIVPLTGALEKIAQLKPSLYNYKSDPTTNIEGFVAHELQSVVPHAVTGQKDAVDAEGNPIYQGVDASFLIPHLTAAIQEQQALITAQAETINALTARIVALEGK